MQPSLSKGDLRKVILRSFLLQGSWNFKKMQNLGFAFALLPALNRIYPDQKDREMAVKRHLEFYNSHPYMASFVLGAVARMEEKHSQGEDVQVEDIVVLKKAMMGPMGALGDSFFWAAFRPVLAIFTATLALIGWTPAPVMFLLFYNIPHLYIKIFGFYQGYLLDKGVLERIRRYHLLQYGIHLKSLMLIILGAMISIVVKLNGGAFQKSPLLAMNAGAFSGILIVAEILRRRVSFDKLLFLVSGICILLGLLHIV